MRDSSCNCEDDDVDGLERVPKEEEEDDEERHHHPSTIPATTTTTTRTSSSRRARITTTSSRGETGSKNYNNNSTNKRPRLANQHDDHDNHHHSKHKRSEQQLLWRDIPDPTRLTCITVNATQIALPQSAQEESQPQQSSSTSLLQDLLYPLDAQIFLQQCFAQCAVHVPAAGTPNTTSTTRTRSRLFLESLIADSLFDLDPLQLLQATASESIFVWLVASSTASSMSSSGPPPPLIHSIEVSNPNDAFHLYQTGGHSTYCRAPPEVERQLVETLLQDTGLTGNSSSFSDPQQQPHPLARGEVELFQSARTGTVTGWHYDFQHNFTLQLSGRKRWKLQSQADKLIHPLNRGCTPHYASAADNDTSVLESQLLAARIADPDFTLRTRVPSSNDHPPASSISNSNSQQPETILTMNAGDVLYFPAGMWHQVEVLEPGVSLNISLMATQTYASLTCQALQHYLVQHSSDWRRPIQNLGDDSLSAVQQLQRLLETLPELVRTLTTTHGGGGAQAMLPPVLHCREEEPDGDAAPPQDDDHSAASSSSSSDDDHPDRPIRVVDFVWPRDATNPRNLAASGRSYILQRNPLALLLSESKDMMSPWNTSLSDKKKNNKTMQDNDKDADDDNVNMPNGNTEEEETFVLNVSYAGNEALESLVRIRLVANPRAVQELELVLAAKGESKDDAVLIMSCANLYRQHQQLMDCLTFYGYILYKEVT